MVKVDSVCGLSCDNSEIEPNDTCDQAGALVPPQPGLGETVYGEIGVACDYDSFKIAIGSTTSVSFSASGADLALELVDCVTDLPLACDDGSAGVGAPRIDACLAAGDYCVRVRATDGAATVGYVLALEELGVCSAPSISADNCPGFDFESCP